MGLAISNAFMHTVPIRVAGMALGYCAYERFAQIVNAKSPTVRTNYLPCMGLIAGALAITQKAIVIYAVALLVLIPLNHAMTKKQLINEIPSFVEDMSATVGLENSYYIPLSRETEQIAVFINNSEKRNVMIIGPAGSGKTALVENIVQRICQYDSTLHKGLKNKKFYRVSCVSLVSGTMYRGDLEQRIKRILDFTRTKKNSVIVFDEIHQLAMANKGNIGGSDVSALDFFKADLARGSISIIGITTSKEFADHLNDPAVQRRFNIMRLQSPNFQDSLKMLKERTKGLLATFPNITVAEDTYEEVLTLTSKLLDQNSSSIDRGYNLLQTAFTAITLDETREGKVCIDKKEIERICTQFFNVELGSSPMLEERLD